MQSINQRRRRTLLIRGLGEACSKLGFVHQTSAYFTRQRGSLQDVFFFQQTRGNNQFYVAYGVDCPKLLIDLRANDVLSPAKDPMLLITPVPVSRLEEGRAYGCKYAEHIESSAKKVCQALEKEALPWLESHVSEADVIEKYRLNEVRLSRPSKDMTLGQIVRWTMYGLLLHDSGETRNAVLWLTRVLQEWKRKDRPSGEDNEWVHLIESRIL